MRIKQLKRKPVSIDLEGNVFVHGKQINFDRATALLILTSTNLLMGDRNLEELISVQLSALTGYKENDNN